MNKVRLPRLAAILIVLVAGIALMRRLPMSDQVAAALEWVHGLGMLGLVLLTLAYTPGALVLLPVWLLTVALGYLYSPCYGFLAAFLGSNSAAAVVFLFGRTLGRRWVEARFGHHPRFRALDRAVGRDGFKIVILTRLSPLLPYTLVNYAFSLTRVSLGTFILGNAVGLVPVTLLYVYVGTTLQRLSDLLESKQSLDWAVLAAGLVPMTVLVVVITRLARRALAEELTEDAAAPGSSA